MRRTPSERWRGRFRILRPAVVSGAEVSAHNNQTGLTRTVRSSHAGSFHFSNLPIGEYSLTVNASGFAPFHASPIRIDIGQVVAYPVELQLAGAHGQGGSNRPDGYGGYQPDHRQCGLREPGGGSSIERPRPDSTGASAARRGAYDSGLAEAGGIARAGQAFAVNGQRPESNNYLLDGASNVDSVNGGMRSASRWMLSSEFRILTLNAPAEYGNTSGATTSVVTKSGGNAFHGDVYDFFRNNALDTRNFFAATTEPLHRNQYGATLGGPSARTRISFSSITRASAIPKARRKRRSCPPRPSAPAIFPGSPIHPRDSRRR